VHHRLNSFLTHFRIAVERRLTRRYIQTICTLILVINLTTFVVAFATSKDGRSIFGPYLGADFGAFYIAGKVFNTHPHQQIYDANLHQQLYLEEFPGAPADSQLPYLNAPFFVLPFTLLAKLPYTWAYLLWLVLSLMLYIAAFSLIWTTLNGIPKDAWLTALLLSLSLMPFLVECLEGGQTSAVGFFGLALALGLERRGRTILSGAALSLCTYKPTLLFLVLPMLVVTRRYSALGGFLAGTAFLTVVSLLSVGWQGCLAYLDTLLNYSHVSAGAQSVLRSWKYSDVNSFFRLLAGEHQYVRWALTATGFLVVLPMIFSLWRKACPKREDYQSLVWALTLAWTPVMNIYVGIYDSTIVVLAALLAADVFFQRADSNRPALPSAFKMILVLLYITPWFTQLLARVTRIQIYTVVLALFGTYQLVVLDRLSRESHPAKTRTLTKFRLYLPSRWTA